MSVIVGKGTPLFFDNADFVHIVNHLTESHTLCGQDLDDKDDIRFEGLPQDQATRLCFRCMTHAVFSVLPKKL